MIPTEHIALSFVSCASNWEVLSQRLLTSPCLQAGGQSLAVHFNSLSAADGFNATLSSLSGAADGATASGWLVWVHQDVFLPAAWDTRFKLALAQALQHFAQLAVVGVYGVTGSGTQARRSGHVLDRGVLLQEAAALPCLVDSLDELLLAVRVDSGLRMDPTLGFDFYGTDLVMQAQQRGLQCAVVDAYCEHWATTPASGAISSTLAQRIQTSAAVFERKWAQRLPVSTPCFEINKVGDVAAFIASVGVTPP